MRRECGTGCYHPQYQQNSKDNKKTILRDLPYQLCPIEAAFVSPGRYAFGFFKEPYKIIEVVETAIGAHLRYIVTVFGRSL